MKKYIIAIALILVLSVIVIGIKQKAKAPAPTNPEPNVQQNNSTGTKPQTNNTTSPSNTSNLLADPINNAKNRITKKPFGIKVSPTNSPVSPEKFSGYHTGTDFETTSEEQNIDVPIYAACDGKLLLKKWATGYGGVAVQSCTLDGQDVTIVYGHLRYASINVAQGSQLKAGEQIAVLGMGYSKETDGERKHLHFGIHIGSTVNILGYVQSQSLLNSWLDAIKYLPNN